MSVLRSLRHRAAILAVAAGFAVYAASLVGLASIDDDLRAASPAPTSSEFVRVSDDLPPQVDHECGDDESRRGREV